MLEAMGYYLRVLSPSGNPMPLDTVRAALKRWKKLKVVGDDGPDWENAVVGLAKNPEESAILELERNPVAAGSLGEEELDEFRDSLDGAKPASGVAWVTAYFKKVRTIYAVRLLSLADDHGDAVQAVMEAIRGAVGGIVQADAEGFSNEAGDHIVWEFSDDVEGPWNMAVLDARGRWRSFQMELGDPAHRKAFLAGKVPKGVEVTE